MKTTATRLALRMGLLYWVFGTLWILLSSELLLVFSSEAQTLLQLDIYKDWAFVIITGWLLYFTLRTWLRRWERKVAEREQSEESFKESNLRLQQIALSLHEAAYLRDVKTRQILYVNPAFEEICGISRERFLKNSEVFTDIIHPDDKQRVLGSHKEAFSIGEPDDIEHRIIHPHKKVRWVRGQMFPVKNEKGEPYRLVRTLEDITDRKRYEEELRQFRCSIEEACDAIFWITQHAEFTYVNEQACRSLGYSREEMLKLRLWDVDSVFPKERWEANWKLFQNKQHTSLDRFESVHRRKDGSTFPVEVSSRHIWFGETQLHVAFVRDITGRKREEHNLKRLTDCFLSFGIDPVENINRMTALCGELLGATCALYNRIEGNLLCSLGQWNTPPDYAPQDSAQGHICYDVIHKGGNDLFVIRNLPQTPYFKSDPNVARYKLQTYVGRAIHFSDTPVGSLCVVFQKDYQPDAEDQRIITIIAAAIGVEENRLQARDRLRTREESYRALADNVPDAITRFDRNLRFVYANRALEEAISTPAPFLMGKTSAELNLPAHQKWNSEIRAVFDTQKPAGFEVEYPTPSGPRHLEVRLVPERSSADVVEFVMALTRDVSERKKTDAERQKLEIQLRQLQKMEAIGQLAGGVAHDFNNILTIIQGNASLLLNPELDPEERPACLHQIVHAAERAASLTRQLLIFSRKQVMRPANVDLNEVVANMTKMLRRILGEDIVLQTNYASETAFIHADAGMIEQVIMNLMVNARDAMPGGGQLTISTSAQNVAKPPLEKNPDATSGTHICLAVKDTGCGIPRENLPRIFEPFFTTKEIGKGTGLGLATVYSIIQQHRGWITVSSEINRGTTFSIHFPAVKEARKEKEAAAAATKLPRGSGTILVVEDERAVRVLVCHLLQQCGYTVLSAETGAAAMKVWQESQNTIQLLLTDIIMPDGMNGYELANRLKAAKPDLKVVYTSGYSGEVVGKGLELTEGVNFLQKPYLPQKLLNVLQDHLNQNERHQRSLAPGENNTPGPS